MSEFKDMNLYQKIQAVGDEVKNIQKNITVETGKNAYKAVADVDVLLAVKAAEKKYGLVSIPVKQQLERSDQVQKIGRDGYTTVTFSDIVKMTVRIINVDKPEENIEVESYGRGLDSGDKGFGKASTYARKYALLNAYKIATGEDPDEQESKQMAVLTQDEKRTTVINYMMTDVNFGQQVLQHFAVSGAEDLTSTQINTIYNNLQKKGKI